MSWGRWRRRAYVAVLGAALVATGAMPSAVARVNAAATSSPLAATGAATAAAGAASSVYEIEPNNTRETATPIGVGASLLGFFGPSEDDLDEDYFSFDAPTAGAYTVEVVSRNSLGASRLLWITTYDSDGTELDLFLGTANDGVATRATLRVAEPGTFYAKVALVSAAYGQDYRVRVLPQWDQGLERDEGGEPNGSWPLGEPIEIGRDKALRREMHRFPDSRDADFYHFYAPAAGTYTIETFDVEATAKTMSVETYDAAGQVLTPYTFPNGDLDVVNRHIVRVVAPGRYFFSVMSYQDVTYGVYSVRVLPEFDQGLTWDATGEPNGSVHLAAPLRTGRWSGSEISRAASGSYQYGRDQDHYHFAATAGQSYSVTVRGTGSYPVRVLDRAGTALVSVSGAPATATFTPAASGTHILAVNTQWGLAAPDGYYEMCVTPAGSECATPVTRLAGPDRYATSASISAQFPSGVPVAFLAAGANFPDALSGSALASRLGGPVLLVPPKGVPDVIAAELARLRPQRIVLLGAPSVVPNETGEAVGRYATAGTADAVTRISGADRFETSARISARFPAGVDVAYIATGMNFPDALSGAALASRTGGPMILTTPTSLPSSVTAELARLRPARIVILGSESVVTAGVAQSLKAYATANTEDEVTRVAGPDRYATSAAVAERFPEGPSNAYVAVGTGFPDALGGAALAGRSGGPLLLVPTDTIPAPIDAELTRLKPGGIAVLGSDSVVSTGVERALSAYVP